MLWIAIAALGVLIIFAMSRSVRQRTSYPSSGSDAGFTPIFGGDASGGSADCAPDGGGADGGGAGCGGDGGGGGGGGD